ncbi:MAG: type II toxin-antitoxin system VapC family toxin [Hyphomonadaceae bacterium]|jgi:predicted nucleic acid-binding protein|nr:type II toxin-antitoxin system VapC family toxin [Hyphomonadaceae bacterium]
MALLFDTNLLIEYLRGRQEARDLLDAQEEQPQVSVGSVLELYAGFKSRREEQSGERLLSEARVLPVTHDIAKRAGVLSRIYSSSHGLDDIDAIIAATAEHHGLRLATLNVKHFPMFPKLKRAY